MVIKKKILSLGHWKIVLVKEINSRVALLDNIGKCVFLSFCCIVDRQKHQDDVFCVAAAHKLLSMIASLEKRSKMMPFE
jgi:hypothetical protein